MKNEKIRSDIEEYRRNNAQFKEQLAEKDLHISR